MALRRSDIDLDIAMLVSQTKKSGRDPVRGLIGRLATLAGIEEQGRG